MRKFTAIFGLTIVMTGCNFINDTGKFWTTFEEELIIKKESDQGPWGGHRRIHWSTDKPNTFKSKIIIEFANRNRWVFVDSSQYKIDDMKKWVGTNELIFPAVLTNFQPENDSITYDLPRLIDKDLTVYKFKTGLVQLNWGSDNATVENGFALLSNDGTELSIYHMWGE